MTFVLLSVIVNDPEKDDPDWVICHVIVPGPEESVAVPAHVPLTLAGEDGSVGLEPPPPPPHAAAAARARVSSARAQRRLIREIDEVFIGRMPRVYRGWAIEAVKLSGRFGKAQRWRVALERDSSGTIVM